MAGAQGVVITTDVPVEGRAAVPCYVDETLPIVGPARAVQVVTSGPMAGGAPMAVRLAPAGTPAVGPCLPIYIMSGILDIQAYTSKVKSVAPANLIAYWPEAEASGTVIRDESGNARNGVYTSVTLGQPGIGDGRTSALYGVGSFGNIAGGGFPAAFNGSEGTLIVWFKVASAGVWSDGSARRIVNIQVDGSNLVQLRRATANSQVQWLYTAGGVASTTTSGTLSTAGWAFMAITWSKSGDVINPYYADDTNPLARIGGPNTGLGVWAGVPAATTTVIGALNTSAVLPWSGWLGPVGVWNTALSAAQIAQLAAVS